MATSASLQAHFEPGVLRSLAEIAEGRGVEVLLSAKNADVLSAELADGLKKTAFSSGLRIEKPIDVRFDSPVYRQVVASQSDARRRQEEFAADRRIERGAASSTTATSPGPDERGGPSGGQGSDPGRGTPRLASAIQPLQECSRRSKWSG